MIIIKLLTMLVHPIFWLVVLLVYMQYKRMAAVKEQLYGVKTGGVWQDVAVATGFGLAGGILGSILMISVGLTLTESGLIYLWPVAILLMLINIRFLCFAYAGGVLALCKLLFGFPPISISQILALVAILHMIESILILVSGHLGATPAYFKDRKGNVVGGFTMQKFWPIPVVALIIMGTGAAVGEGIQMPDWWPLLEPGLTGDNEQLIYTMIAVVAGLGYGDLAIARNPRDKSKKSSIFLALYSIVLLILALGSEASRIIALAAALFSFLGHELVIYIGRQMEFSSKPLYVPHPQGLRVLDVVPGTEAWRGGIRSGDVLLTVNDIPVKNRTQFEIAMSTSRWLVELGYLSLVDGRYYREVLQVPSSGEPFGILPVPEGNEENLVELNTKGPLARWWESVQKKPEDKKPNGDDNNPKDY